MAKFFISNPNTRFFLPTDNNSLAFWFSAKDTSSVILNGNNVQEWRDKSQFNRHISAPATTNQPLWVPSATDGMPLLRFDGTDDILRNTTTGTAGLNNVTILAVFRFVSGVDGDIPITFGSTLGAGGSRGLMRASNQLTLGFTGYLRDVLSSNYSTDIGGSFHLFEMWNTALSGGNNIFLGRDGINNSYTPSGSLNATLNGFSVGSFTPQISTWASNIEIREILAFSTNLSTANLQKAEGYLMHEWGMQSLLPAVHPFRNRPPLVSD